MRDSVYVVFILDKDATERTYDMVIRSVTLETLKEVSCYLHSLPSDCRWKVDKVTFVDSEFYYRTIMDSKRGLCYGN